MVAALKHDGAGDAWWSRWGFAILHVCKGPPLTICVRIFRIHKFQNSRIQNFRIFWISDSFMCFVTRIWFLWYSLGNTQGNYTHNLWQALQWWRLSRRRLLFRHNYHASCMRSMMLHSNGASCFIFSENLATANVLNHRNSVSRRFLCEFPMTSHSQSLTGHWRWWRLPRFRRFIIRRSCLMHGGDLVTVNVLNHQNSVSKRFLGESPMKSHSQSLAGH